MLDKCETCEIVNYYMTDGENNGRRFLSLRGREGKLEKTLEILYKKILCRKASKNSLSLGSFPSYLTNYVTTDHT